MGDVKVGGSAENLDGALEDDDGGSSVNVVIPTYKDGFAPSDCMLDPRDGFPHSLHAIRRMQMVDLGIKKLKRRVTGRDSASDEQAGYHGREPGLALDLMSELVV